jgi:hypothetical protein
MWWIAEHVYAYRHVHRFAFLLCMLVLLSACSGKHVDICDLSDRCAALDA